MPHESSHIEVSLCLFISTLYKLLADTALSALHSHCSQSQNVVKAAKVFCHDNVPRLDSDVMESRLGLGQKGLCAYLGFPLSLDVKSIGGEATDWALSPERLNDDGGYTIDNLVLVVRGQFCRARSARRQTSQVVQEEGR